MQSNFTHQSFKQYVSEAVLILSFVQVRLSQWRRTTVGRPYWVLLTAKGSHGCFCSTRIRIKSSGRRLSIPSHCSRVTIRGRRKLICSSLLRICRTSLWTLCHWDGDVEIPCPSAAPVLGPFALTITEVPVREYVDTGTATDRCQRRYDFCLLDDVNRLQYRVMKFCKGGGWIHFALFYVVEQRG